MAKTKPAAVELAELLAPPVWTVSAIAKLLKISRSTVYGWLGTGGQRPTEPTATQAEWLRENLGIKGSWKK